MTEYYTPSHIKSVLFELALETVSDDNAVCQLTMLALVADRLDLAEDAQRLQTLARVLERGYGLNDPTTTALKCLGASVSCSKSGAASFGSKKTTCDSG